MSILEDLIVDIIDQGMTEGYGAADTALEVFKLISQALNENGVSVEGIDLGELEVQSGIEALHV